MTQDISNELWNEFEKEIKNIKEYLEIEITPEENNTLNLFFKKFLDQNEIFPQGSRHKTIEKNMAIWIVKNNIPIEQIKQAYINKKFNFESLNSWLKTIQKGKFDEFNLGEIVNWCKKFRPDLVDLFSDIKHFDETEIIRRSDLIFPTAHLSIFNYINLATQIFGKEYIHLKKLLFYHLVSCCIPESLLIVKHGQIEIDLRDYLFLVYGTGSAKGNVKNTITKILKELGFAVVQLTSYHDEQLVGKVVNRGTKKRPDWIKNYGHFYCDELIIDECKPLLIEREKEIGRNWFLLAMDKYKQNLIYKRLTENLDEPDEVLEYFPKFNCLLGTQPFQFPEESIVLNGFMKRVTIDYIPPINRPNEIFNQRLDEKTDLTPIYNKIISFLQRIKNIKNDFGKYIQWTFADDFDITFKKCYEALRNAGLYNSRKKRNYTRLVEWQLQDRLLRRSCLLAISKDLTTQIKGAHVELAFIDLLEDFIIELDFINNKVFGDLDYGSVWGTSNIKEKRLLKILYNAGATSEESTNFRIDDFQIKIQEVYKIGIDQARKIYYKLVENNLINSKRIGQYGSKVWLTNIPNAIESDTSDTSATWVKNFYFYLINKYGVKNDI